MPAIAGRDLAHQPAEERRRSQQHHRRDGELVDELHLGLGALQPRRADDQRDAGPAGGAAEAHQVADQRLRRARRRPAEQRQRHAGDRQHQADQAAQAHPLAGNQEVRAQRHPDGHGVEQHRGATDRRMLEPEEQQQELAGEQQAAGDAGPERAVREAQSPPGRQREQQHQRQRAGRAQPRLEGRRQAGVDQLDQHLVQAHQSREADQCSGADGIDPVLHAASRDGGSGAPRGTLDQAAARLIGAAGPASAPPPARRG